MSKVQVETVDATEGCAVPFDQIKKVNSSFFVLNSESGKLI